MVILGIIHTCTALLTSNLWVIKDDILIDPHRTSDNGCMHPFNSSLAGS